MANDWKAQRDKAVAEARKVAAGIEAMAARMEAAETEEESFAATDVLADELERMEVGT